LNAIVYDAASAKEMADIFFRDKKLSAELTEETFKDQSWKKKVRQNIAKLVSPIL